GPAGSAGHAPPPVPPPTYAGTFSLEIQNDGVRIPVRSFGGCYDKVLGIEYEDCYISVVFAAPSVTQWLNDTVDGSNPTRDFSIIQYDALSHEVRRTNVTGAFLSGFVVDDPDASVASPAELLMVAVPSSLQTVAGSGAIQPPNTFSTVNRLNTANFAFSISGVDGSRIARVHGLQMSAAKSPGVAVGSRHYFLQGPVGFHDLQLEIASGGNTIANMETWLASVASGVNDQRTGTLEWKKPDLVTVLSTIQLFDLSPLAFLPYPLGTTPSDAVGLRLATLAVGSFHFQ
ncbi:MAG: hypothetical protein ABJC89_25545, partial [Acidobacteriota bacterium]